jgi:hypothetical protein
MTQLWISVSDLPRDETFVKTFRSALKQARDANLTDFKGLSVNEINLI